MVDVSILQRSLAILESMVLNSQALYQKIAEEVTVGQLLSHLQVSNQEIQTYAIALINALFLKAPEDKRQEMADASAQKQLRLAILTIVLENSSPEDQHACPFGRSAIELTKVLCEVLQIGELRKRSPVGAEPLWARAGTAL
ncbi:hypothetical protein L345_16645, partial [Ophiophagus hannah]